MKNKKRQLSAVISQEGRNLRQKPTPPNLSLDHLMCMDTLCARLFYLFCLARSFAFNPYVGRFSTSSFPRASDGGTGFPHRNAEPEPEEGGMGGAEEEDEFEDPRDAILDAALNHVEEHG